MREDTKTKESQRDNLRAVDLFSGCGGVTLGLKRAGFRVIGAVEIDPLAVATYRTNHPEVKIKQEDIGAVPARAFMRELGIQKGELDLLSGCPPCQGFSRLRTKNGSARNRDARNGLSSEMLRFARALLPKAVMMENVPNLARHKSFRDLCDGLSHLGYHVSYEVKDAARYGVPQRRRRLILVAGRGFTINLAPEAKTIRTVRDAIATLPLPGASGDLLHDLYEKRSERILQLIRDIPKDGGSRTDLPPERQLACHKKNDGFHDIYGRMAWDEVAPTITGGCFNPSKGRFLHPEQDRAITLREAAALQGFPRRYIFDMSSGKQATALMIGNALPPEFVCRQARVIRKAIKQPARSGMAPST